MYTLRSLVGAEAAKELISNVESSSLAEDAPAPRVGGIDAQTSYESWSAGSMKGRADENLDRSKGTEWEVPLFRGGRNPTGQKWCVP